MTTAVRNRGRLIARRHLDVTASAVIGNSGPHWDEVPIAAVVRLEADEQGDIS